MAMAARRRAAAEPKIMEKARMPELGSAPCPNCAASGWCPVCKGNGLLLAEHVIEACLECHGYGQVGAKGERTWCRRCGGNGRELIYEQLIQCPECISDGNCIACEGAG